MAKNKAAVWGIGEQTSRYKGLPHLKRVSLPEALEEGQE